MTRENESRRTTNDRCSPMLIVVGVYFVLFVIVSLIFWGLENSRLERTNQLLTFLKVLQNFTAQNTCTEDKKVVEFLDKVYRTFGTPPPRNITKFIDEVAIIDDSNNNSNRSNILHYVLKENSHLSISDSFVFCASIFTTVGYGNTTPTSTLAKYLTIFVSLLSIPVTYILLTSIAYNLHISVYSFFSSSHCFSKRVPKEKTNSLENGITDNSSTSTAKKKKVPTATLR